MAGTGHRRWAAVAAVILLAAFSPAAAGDDSPPQGVVVFTDGVSTAGLAAQGGATATGVLLHVGRAATLECLEFVEGRDKTHTVYARYLSGTDRFWVGIASHVQGSTQAMGGIARSPTSENRCGAGGVAPVTPLTMACGSHGVLRDIT